MGIWRQGGWAWVGDQNSSLWIHGKYMTPHICRSFRCIHHKNKQPLLHITRNSTRKRIKMEYRLYRKEKKKWRPLLTNWMSEEKMSKLELFFFLNKERGEIFNYLFHWEILVFFLFSGAFVVKISIACLVSS